MTEEKYIAWAKKQGLDEATLRAVLKYGDARGEIMTRHYCVAMWNAMMRDPKCKLTGRQIRIKLAEDVGRDESSVRKLIVHHKKKKATTA